jgi:hypothetical protein
MTHGKNFLVPNLREQIEKVLNTKELVYPVKLVDFSLRNFDFERLGAKLHYWNAIQIHELLDDSNVFPEKLDDNIWYQYISAYLILPKMKELIEINSFAWNESVEHYNYRTIKGAVRTSLSLLDASSLSNKKIVEQTSLNLTDSLTLDRIKTALSKKELSYSLDLLEIHLRNMEIRIHYSNIIPMHAFLKYTGILPAEYDYNLWYRCVTAYIIATYVDIEKLMELNKNGWTESVRKANEELVFDIDIIVQTLL